MKCTKNQIIEYINLVVAYNLVDHCTKVEILKERSFGEMAMEIDEIKEVELQRGALSAAYFNEF